MYSKSPLHFEILKTITLPFAMVVAMVVSILSGSATVQAQAVVDTIRVNTRVVFMDALVKDKRTGVPISDLKPENFEILDEGNARPISYFTREGRRASRLRWYWFWTLEMTARADS
jgi:hypothetical protein